MLRIFTPVKIQRLRPGLNPRPWVPEASMLTTRPPKPSILLCRDILKLVTLPITRWRSRLRKCATSRKVAGSILGVVIGNLL